jgi:2-iminobutanoate/2-iminopropanoate deaminase
MAKNVIQTTKAPLPILPDSVQAINIGPLIFISSLGAEDPTTGNYPESLEDQMRSSLNGVKAVMQSAGGSMPQLLARTVYNLRTEGVDTKTSWRTHIIQMELFEQPVASTTLRVGKFAPGRLLENEITASTMYSKEEIVTDEAAETRVQTSAQGVKAGPFVFITGYGGRKPEFRSPRWGIPKYLKGAEAQTKEALKAVEAILRAAGTGWDNTLFFTMYIYPDDDPQAVLKVIEEHLPASAGLVIPLVRLNMGIPSAEVGDLIALAPGYSKKVFPSGANKRVSGVAAGPLAIAFSEAKEGNDIERQLAQVFEELTNIFKGLDCSMEQLVRLRVYIRDEKDLTTLTGAIGKYCRWPVTSAVVKTEGFVNGARLAITAKTARSASPLRAAER